MTETFVTERGQIVVDEEVADVEIDPTGWWCIKTSPFPCPHPDCTFVALYSTAMHRIIVWPEKDDDRLLDLAVKLQAVERNPRVVEYEVSMGPCISYDLWESLHRPVHAIRGK